MAIEQTLSIIKPDAVKKNVIGQIYARFEHAGLKINFIYMMSSSLFVLLMQLISYYIK